MFQGRDCDSRSRTPCDYKISQQVVRSSNPPPFHKKENSSYRILGLRRCVLLYPGGCRCCWSPTLSQEGLRDPRTSCKSITFFEIEKRINKSPKISSYYKIPPFSPYRFFHLKRTIYRVLVEWVESDSEFVARHGLR